LFRLLDGGGHFRGERAGAEILDHNAMLLLDEVAQRIFAEPGGNRELLVARRPPVEDASILINGRVDEAVVWAAVLGLDV
jgi:predicted ATPase with chaperone activity